jgi:hypothetical protein
MFNLMGIVLETDELVFIFDYFRGSKVNVVPAIRICLWIDDNKCRVVKDYLQFH